MAKPDVAERETLTERNVRYVVKALLGARDMNGAELAEVMGISPPRIYNRLKGVKPFTVAEVATMSAYFGVPVGVFFAGPNALFGGETQGAGSGMGGDAVNRHYQRTTSSLAIPAACIVSLGGCILWTECQELASPWVLAA